MREQIRWLALGALVVMAIAVITVCSELGVVGRGSAAIRQFSEGDLSSPCIDRRDDTKDVRAVAEGIIDADNAGDLDRVLGYYADEATLLPPNERAVSGRGAIRPRYESLFRSHHLVIESRIHEVEVSGDLAYVRGENLGKVVSKEDGTSRPIQDAYLMLLKRSAAGAWRIWRLMWSPNAPSVDRGSGQSD